jgi:hypothetical protein
MLASSVWQSSSSIASKSFCFLSRAASQVEFVVSLGQQKTFVFSSSNPLTLAPTAATSSIPGSGSATAVLLGNHLGANSFSARARTSGSACQSTRWFSDSSMLAHVSAGVGISDVSIVLTFHERVAIQLPHFYKLNYAAPLASVATSQRLSNISVVGSSFGPYLSVIPFASSVATPATIGPKDKVSVCSLNVESESATATVAEAALRVTFSGSSRLDDVSILLRTPDNKEFVLMKNKCYGSLPCGSEAISFGFQILPLPQSIPGVPVANCPSSGAYLADEGDSIRSYMLNNAISGAWSLVVLTGSQSQTAASASMFIKTGSLDFVIKSSSSTSLAWSSDSSVVMNAPGYQVVQGIETCAGFGRNHSVKARSSSSAAHTSSSCTYSYPDPLLNATIGSFSLPSSGSSFVTFVGRLLSNANPSPLARLGSSSCAATVWQSDTALLCLGASFLPRHRILSSTLHNSAIATFNSSSSFYPTQIAVAPPVATLPLHFPMTSAPVIVAVTGAGFGSSSFSSRGRLRTAMSSAVSTAWVGDSSISTRVFPAHFVLKSSSLLIVSVLSSAINSTEFEFKHVLKTLTRSRGNIPCTGTVLVGVIGAGFAHHSTSLSTSLGGSCCVDSRWTSDSSVVCKAPSGTRSTERPVVTSLGGASQAPGRITTIQYDAPAANASAVAVENNANVCVFNSSRCEPGHLVQLVHSSSGFGSGPIPSRLLSVIQGTVTRPCDNSSWVSDSSVQCLFAAALSPEFFSLHVVVQVASTQTQISIRNPFYVPAPPLLSNSTVNVRFFRMLHILKAKTTTTWNLGRRQGLSGPTRP